MDGISHIGLIGLGTMGSKMALSIASKPGMRVHVYNRSRHKTNLFSDRSLNKGVRGKVEIHNSPNELFDNLHEHGPASCIYMIPHGTGIDHALTQVSSHFQPGDIIMDGADEHHKRSQRRGKRLGRIGVSYLGVGISGGYEGSLHGPCLMVGGTKHAYMQVQDTLQSIAGDSPVGYHGSKFGCGHFIKSVYRGIESTFMQVISELYHYFGRDVLLDSLESLPVGYGADGYLVQITKHILGTWDIDRIGDTYQMNDTGLWCAQYALEHKLPVPMLSASVSAQLLTTRCRKMTDYDSFMVSQHRSIDNVIHNTILFAFASALNEGELLCTHFGVDFAKVLHGWKSGSVISCPMFERDDICHDMSVHAQGAKAFVGYAHMKGCPVPAIGAALSWYSTMSSSRLPSCLIMAQRNEYGAHKMHRSSGRDKIRHAGVG